MFDQDSAAASFARSHKTGKEPGNCASRMLPPAEFDSAPGGAFTSRGSGLSVSGSTCGGGMPAQERGM